MYFGTPYTKATIEEAVSAEITSLHTFYQALDEHTFFAAPPGVWSPAENLAHLIQSNKPIILALGLPKIALRARFGRAKHSSRALEQIRHLYVNKALAGGGKAGGTFLPIVKEQTAAEKAKILSKWQAFAPKYSAAFAKWTDGALDKYILPHPLIGNLTLREMLFFTLYHNMHHLHDTQRLLNQPETEWFDRV